MNFDVIIIGGGVAGLSAGFWCDELGLSSIVFESEGELGGQLLWTYNAINNYLGLEAANGRELREKFLKQIEKRKFEIKLKTSISSVDLENKKVTLANNQVISSKFLIVASGIKRRRLNVEGEDNFQGRGIISSGKRDAAMVVGKNVCIVGGGDAALENVLILGETAENVTLIHRRDEFRARAEFVEKLRNNPKVTILTETEITRIIGEDSLEALELRDIATRQTRIYPTDALLVRIGVTPNNEFLSNRINLDKNGYCLIDSNCETNVRNVFAVGDIANPIAPTISSAVGMSATAIKVVSARLT